MKLVSLSLTLVVAVAVVSSSSDEANARQNHGRGRQSNNRGKGGSSDNTRRTTTKTPATRARACQNAGERCIYTSDCCTTSNSMIGTFLECVKSNRTLYGSEAGSSFCAEPTTTTTTTTTLLPSTATRSGTTPELGQPELKSYLSIYNKDYEQSEQEIKQLGRAINGIASSNIDASDADSSDMVTMKDSELRRGPRAPLFVILQPDSRISVTNLCPNRYTRTSHSRHSEEEGL